MVQKSLTFFITTLWRTISGLFWLSLWFFSLGLLASYLLRWWPGDRLFPVRLINYAMPWLLFALAPGLIVALLARRQWLAVSFALPTLLIMLNYAPLFLPRPTLALAGNEPFKVMSYNVWSRYRDLTPLVEVIKKEQPDILLLQEVRRYQAPQIEEALADLYPEARLHFVYDVELEQAVASRYPLTVLGVYPRKGKALEVLAETPSGPITVWNVHPSSRRGWYRRYNQIANLMAENIANAQGPIILGGDFNTTDQTQTYRLVDQYLNNAHWQAGWGFGFTFPAPTREFRRDISLPALVRIDHIFYSDHFFAHQASTLSDSGGSDHLPVVATLSIIRLIND
jgi:vancomycin resistance protein VanJ